MHDRERLKGKKKKEIEAQRKKERVVQINQCVQGTSNCSPSPKI